MLRWRAWRAALSTPSLYTHLDFSTRIDKLGDQILWEESAVGQPVTEDLFRHVLSFCRGVLKHLDVSSAVYTIRNDARVHLYFDDILDAVKAHRNTLQELIMRDSWHVIGSGRTTYDEIQQLLAAGSAIKTLEANLRLTPKQSCSVLRREQPFGALRCSMMYVSNVLEDSKMISAPEVVALATELSTSNLGLRGLELSLPSLKLVPTLDALVRGVIDSRMLHLCINCGMLSPAAVPAFVVLLREGHLTSLNIENVDVIFLNAETAMTVRCLATSESAHPRRAVFCGATREYIAHPTVIDKHLLVERRRCRRGAYRRTCWPPVTAHLGFRRQLCARASVINSVGDTLPAACRQLPRLGVVAHKFVRLGDGVVMLAETLSGNTHLARLTCDFDGMSKAGSLAFLGGVRLRNPSFRILDHDFRYLEGDGDHKPALRRAVQELSGVDVFDDDDE